VPAKSLLLSAREGRTWAEAVAARDAATDHREDRAGVQSLREARVDLLTERRGEQPGKRGLGRRDETGG
jgi:hypothetical protein